MDSGSISGGAKGSFSDVHMSPSSRGGYSVGGSSGIGGGGGGVSMYFQDDIIHDTDFLTPLHQGTIRYVPAPHLAPEIRYTLPVKNDRHYVFVPAGYVTREEKKFLTYILSALGLSLPNLIVVTAATEGTKEEQMANFAVQDIHGDQMRGGRRGFPGPGPSTPLSGAALLTNGVLSSGGSVASNSSYPVQFDYPKQSKDILFNRTEHLLKSTVESCVEMGAWILPEEPRRRNGAAQLICTALRKCQNGTPISLGIIGIDDHDEEEGLKESIQQNMVPIGSPIKKVTKISYDDEIKDGAPCPQLTHLLIFESPHEMELFRRALLTAVSSFLIAFGNITNDAMRSVYQYAADGNPILVFKHTGRKVDNICKMFNHVDHELKRMKLVEEQMEMHHHVPTDAAITEINTQSCVPETIRIAPMDDMEDELIKIFVSIWPADFNAQSVVLADPMQITGSKLEEYMLKSITACFDIQTGSADLQRAKKGVLDYAWSFYDITRRHAFGKKNDASVLHMQLVSCTVLAIIISVIYSEVYSGTHPSGSTPFQLIFFVSTILLPLYIINLKRETESNDPAVQYATFKVASSRIESEILKMRAQVGTYRPLEKNQAEMRKPMNLFLSNTREIWASLRKYLADDGMDIPDSFWEFGTPFSPDGEFRGGGGFGGESDDGMSAHSQDLKSHIESALHGSRNLSVQCFTGTKTLVFEFWSGVKFLSSHVWMAVSATTAKIGGAVTSMLEKVTKKADEEETPEEATPALDGSNHDDGQGSIAHTEESSLLHHDRDEEKGGRNAGGRNGGGRSASSSINREHQQYGSYRSEMNENNVVDGGWGAIDVDADDPLSRKMIRRVHDDKYSPITADLYIEIRMKEQMRIKSEELAFLTMRNRQVSNTIKGVTLVAGAAAALALQWLVPVVLAFTAAFGSSQDFQQYRRRIELANAMIVQLNELKLWWMGLSMYQQQLHHNKDKLILESEKIILNEIIQSCNFVPKGEF